MLYIILTLLRRLVDGISLALIGCRLGIHHSRYVKSQRRFTQGLQALSSALTASFGGYGAYPTCYPDKQATASSYCAVLSLLLLCCLVGYATLLFCSCMMLQGSAALHTAFLSGRLFSSSRRCGCDVYGCRCRRHEAPLGRSVLGYRPSTGRPSVRRTS